MPERRSSSGEKNEMHSTPSRTLRQKPSRSAAPGNRPAIPITATSDSLGEEAVLFMRGHPWGNDDRAIRTPEVRADNDPLTVAASAPGL